MEIIIGKSKNTGNPIPFGTHSDAVQIPAEIFGETITPNKQNLTTMLTWLHEVCSGLQTQIDNINGDNPIDSDNLTGLTTRLQSLETLISDDGNPTEAIDKFNEIVSFLNQISNTDSLDGLLNDIRQTISNLETLMNNRYIDVSNTTHYNVDKYNIYRAGIYPVEQRSRKVFGNVKANDFKDTWNSSVYETSNHSRYKVVAKIPKVLAQKWGYMQETVIPMFYINGIVSIVVALGDLSIAEAFNNGNSLNFSASNVLSSSLATTLDPANGELVNPANSTYSVKWYLNSSQKDTLQEAILNDSNITDVYILTSEQDYSKFNFQINSGGSGGTILYANREEIYFGIIEDTYPSLLYVYSQNQINDTYDRMTTISWDSVSSEIKSLWGYTSEPMDIATNEEIENIFN